MVVKKTAEGLPREMWGRRRRYSASEVVPARFTSKIFTCTGGAGRLCNWEGDGSDLIAAYDSLGKSWVCPSCGVELLSFA